MTPEELQEVVAAVIAALKTNGKTIDQLTPVTTLANSDNLEVSNGKKVSFGKLKELVASSVVVTEESIKGWVPIESTDELPEDPTPEQQEKAYIIADESTLYVYVGENGDTLDGLYQSVDLQGPQGDPGTPGADGHDGVDLGEVALINDLTTGGEGNALSAEMGKVLGQRTEYPMEMVQPSESGAIRPTSGLDWAVGGWWRTPYTKIDPTKPIYAKGDSNNSSVAFVAFYDDNLVCKGTISKIGAAGVEYEIQVPEGATCARVVCTTAQKETSYLTQKVQRNLTDVVVEHDETLNEEINLIDLVKSFTPGYLELNTGVQMSQLYRTTDYIFINQITSTK